MVDKCDIKEDIVLDLGCGYGLVGIYCAKVIEGNNVIIIQSDAYENISGNDFALMLCNPPYHAGFSVPKRFIEQGHKKLAYGGRMFMVTKRLEWYKRKFISVFGGVKIFRYDGYFVFMGVKSADLKIKKEGN